MLRTLLNRLGQSSRRPSAARRSPGRPSFRPRLEALEQRDVPSTSPFFLDSNHQLWTAADATGKQFTPTGGFGVQLRAGEVNAAGGGGQFAVFRDGNNHVWLFNGNNDVFTDTGAFAVDLAAGRGEVFLRDGNNQVYVLTLGALNADGTFGVTATQTAAFAVQMSVGFDTTQGQDFLAYRAGDNSVNVIENVAGNTVYGASGAFAIDLAAGNAKETFIRDGNNQISVLTIDTASAGGIAFAAPVSTPAFALEMSVGQNLSGTRDMLVYRAGDDSVHFINSAPGTPVAGFVDVPGAFASQVVAGSGEIFTRDAMNQVHYFTLDMTGAGTTETATGVFATQLRDTAFSTAAVDQLALIDTNQHLIVSQNAADGTVTFIDTGMIANDVQGYAMNP